MRIIKSFKVVVALPFVKLNDFVKYVCMYKKKSTAKLICSVHNTSPSLRFYKWFQSFLIAILLFTCVTNFYLLIAQMTTGKNKTRNGVEIFTASPQAVWQMNSNCFDAFAAAHVCVIYTVRYYVCKYTGCTSCVTAASVSFLPKIVSSCDIISSIFLFLCCFHFPFPFPLFNLARIDLYTSILG